MRKWRKVYILWEVSPDSYANFTAYVFDKDEVWSALLHNTAVLIKALTSIVLERLMHNFAHCSLPPEINKNLTTT